MMLSKLITLNIKGNIDTLKSFIEKLILIGGLAVCSINYSYAEQPLDSSEYQNIIGIGLATSYFKVDIGDDKYNRQHLKDFRARGFTNLRLRVASNYYDDNNDLTLLKQVVDDCLAEDIVPIISWLNEKDPGIEDINQSDIGNSVSQETFNGYRDDYVNWWKNVAIKLDGLSHRLSFNLFTEISNDKAIETSYNEWTKLAVAEIRKVSKTRMIILAAPSKTPDSLTDIAEDIYKDDPYMMVEWHSYASGPNQRGGQKNWIGEGSADDRKNVTDLFDIANEFTNTTGLQSYLGAWMPMSNTYAHLSQEEVLSFSDFFIGEMAKSGVPWTANATQHYYNIETNEWLLTNDYEYKDDPNGANDGDIRTLDMVSIVDSLVENSRAKVERIKAIVSDVTIQSFEESSATIYFSVAEGSDSPWLTLFYGTENGGKEADNWQHVIELSKELKQAVYIDGEYTFSLPDLNSNTEYFIQLRANNSAGEAWLLNSESFTIPIESESKITNNSGGSFHLWTLLSLMLLRWLKERTLVKYLRKFRSDT